MRLSGVAVTLLLVAACGNGTITGDDDDRDSGPIVFVPDPVTMGEGLPPVLPVVKVIVGGQPIAAALAAS